MIRSTSSRALYTNTYCTYNRGRCAGQPRACNSRPSARCVGAVRAHGASAPARRPPCCCPSRACQGRCTRMCRCGRCRLSNESAPVCPRIRAALAFVQLSVSASTSLRLHEHCTKPLGRTNVGILWRSLRTGVAFFGTPRSGRQIGPDDVRVRHMDGAVRFCKMRMHGERAHLFRPFARASTVRILLVRSPPRRTT